MEFPVFESMDQLVSDPTWSRYMDRVYDLSTLGHDDFPLDTGGFDMYYLDLLPSGFRDRLTITACPSEYRQLFDPGNLLFGGSDNYRDIIFRYQFHIPRRLDGVLVNLTISPFSSNSKIEVFHSCCDAPGMGYWFYYAPGSGIFLDLGKTMAFHEKTDAWEHLMNEKIRYPVDTDRLNLDIFREARKKGVDSIQYLSSGMTAGTCDGYGIYTIEIQFITTESQYRGFYWILIVIMILMVLVSFILSIIILAIIFLPEKTRFLKPHVCPSKDSNMKLFCGWKGRRPFVCNEKKCHSMLSLNCQ